MMKVAGRDIGILLRTEFLNSYVEALTARVTVSRDRCGDKLNRAFTKRGRVTSTTSFTFNTALPPIRGPSKVDGWLYARHEENLHQKPNLV